jgi:hypothetical protein
MEAGHDGCMKWARIANFPIPKSRARMGGMAGSVWHAFRNETAA